MKSTKKQKVSTAKSRKLKREIERQGKVLRKGVLQTLSPLLASYAGALGVIGNEAYQTKRFNKKFTKYLQYADDLNSPNIQNNYIQAASHVIAKRTGAPPHFAEEFVKRSPFYRDKVIPEANRLKDIGARGTYRLRKIRNKFRGKFAGNPKKVQTMVLAGLAGTVGVGAYKVRQLVKWSKAQKAKKKRQQQKKRRGKV